MLIVTQGSRIKGSASASAVRCQPMWHDSVWKYNCPAYISSNRVDSHAMQLTRAIERLRDRILPHRFDYIATRRRKIIDPSYAKYYVHRVQTEDGESESFITHFTFVKFNTSQERYYCELRRGVCVSRAIVFCLSSNSRWRTESPLDCNKGYVKHTTRSTSVFISFRANEVRWSDMLIQSDLENLSYEHLKLESLFNSFVVSLARANVRQLDSLQKRIVRSLVNREHRGIFGLRPNSPYICTLTPNRLDALVWYIDDTSVGVPGSRSGQDGGKEETREEERGTCLLNKRFSHGYNVRNWSTLR